MNIESILKYQSLDSELFKIEKSLRESQNKKKVDELRDNMKSAQTKSFKLEENAGKLIGEIEKVKQQVKTQEGKMQEFLSKDLESMSKEDLQKLSALKDKLNQNLIILEKNLTALAENMNAILAEFNKTIKTFNNCRSEYAKRKQVYEQDVANAEAKKKELASSLAALAKGIDPKLMEAYLKRRSENVFPVLVPLNGNCCGGCHMELPFAVLTKINEEGHTTCEHCRRIVYVKK